MALLAVCQQCYMSAVSDISFSDGSVNKQGEQCNIEQSAIVSQLA
jgi:hypothetical protein